MKQDITITTAKVSIRYNIKQNLKEIRILVKIKSKTRAIK